MNQILIGVIASMGLAGYLYYSSTQNELTTLRDLNKVYELKHEQQEEALRVLEEDFSKQTQAMSEMQVANQQIQLEMSRYLDIFKRHNLTKLAAAKPGLIESRANKATKEVFDGIEQDSAALDALDDGVRLATESTSGSQDNNEASRAQDSTADTTESN